MLGLDYLKVQLSILKMNSGATAPGGTDAETPEGTAVKSTGESGGTKFLEDGDGTFWQAAPAGTPTTIRDIIPEVPLIKVTKGTSGQYLKIG